MSAAATAHDADHVRNARPEEGRQPARRIGHGPGTEGVEHGEADARRQGKRAEVEGELDRRLPPVEGEGHRGPHRLGDDDVQWHRQEHADHERELIQRERVGAPTEVEMDDPSLGDPEPGREDEPRQLP